MQVGGKERMVCDERFDFGKHASVCAKGQR